jgi:N-acetylglucosaminyl-diphospho-decaprenol L-rhamnosyltransferase
MTYAVVVVLHRSRDELARLLGSIAPAQLVVVDAGPDDGGVELARNHGAQVIVRRDNPGFGAANNLALERVDADVTVLLNPDTIDARGALAELAHRARQRGLHAPRLLNPDGSVQRSAHPLPGTVGAFIPALVHPPLLPRAIRDRVEPYRARTPRTVGWAVAAALAARTDTLKALGPFDPAIHLFAEDMDLCLRARARGIPTILHPDLTLTHTGGHSVLREGEPFAAFARQRRAVVEARRGRRARRLDDAAQALTFATRALVKRPNDRERAQLNALLDTARPGS